MWASRHHGGVLLHRGPLPAGDQACELAVAHALVRRASLGEIDGALRVYRPSAPVVVFGRRELRHDGWREAADAARAAGFEPAVRAAGGRAVAYTGEALVVDHVMRETNPGQRLEQRFEEFGELLATALRGLGVDARVGAVPGEYCPGAHSVNARGTVKLIGTAQRIVKQAWLFSTIVVVGDAARVRPVLTEVYGLLRAEFDADSVGALDDEVPGLGVEAVEAALLDAYGVRPDEAVALDTRTLELADELAEQHRVR